jgi:hypothetical protein
MSTPAPKFTREIPGPVQVLVTKPYEIEGRNSVVFVIPGTIHLDYENPPKTIEWVNQSGGPVKIWLPNGDHFFKPYEDPETHEIHQFTVPFDVSTEGLRLDVKEQLTTGSYEYNVYCDSIKDYAKGDSSPRVSCP